MDFERRLTGLQQRMAAEGLALVVYGAGGDLQYLTGVGLDWRSAAAEAGPAAGVFVPRTGPPVLVLAGEWANSAGRTWIADVRVCHHPAEQQAVVRSVLDDLDAGAGQAAVGSHVTGAVAMQVRTAAGGAQPRSAAGLMDHLRMFKDPEEIEHLREAARLVGEALQAVVPCITEGVTQGEIEAEVARQGCRLGASGVSFSPTVRFTKSGSAPADDPFTYPMDEGLVEGTSIVFDFGFVTDGYCSDFGRSFHFGPPGRDVSEGYRALHASLLETVALMHEGSMRICDLFPTVERALDRLGYGDRLRARLAGGILGHSIGIDVHEYPWINPACKDPLGANMVMAIEPKLWRPGEYYLRVEDVVLVGRERTEILTSFDRELFHL